MIKRYQEYIKENIKKYPTREDIEDEFLRLVEVLHCICKVHKFNPSHDFRVVVYDPDDSGEYTKEMYNEIYQIKKRMTSIYKINFTVEEIPNNFMVINIDYIK